jgi:DNA-binding CsgD family transcriptional regulator
MAEEIIGRREELLVLGEFVEAVPAGGAALLFEGDAGIGKTALWQEGVCLSRARGFRVLEARAAQSESQMAFATIGDLFAPVLEGTLPRLVPVQRRALEIAFLMREPDVAPPEGRLLAAALLSIVRLLAEDRPLVLALDDAQWIDASSADLLRFVLRRLEAEPVGVLATARGRPVEAPLELDRAFAQFRRLPVARLSLAAIHRLLRVRLALTLPRPVLVRVHETVGGNPFFALELGRALVDRRIGPDSESVSLPESLRAVVAQRLSALPSRVRETLVSIAAIAAPTVTLLQPLNVTAIDDIEFARQHGVLELEGDRIRFSHPLLAPACYEAMPLHHRRRVHRRVADLDLDLEEQALHLAIAATGPDEEIAAALDAAAAHAQARGAALAAAELAERAVALTPPAAIERINRRRITAADRCLYSGDVQKTRALLGEVVDSARPGPVRADALSRLGGMGPATQGFGPARRYYGLALAEPDLAIRQRVKILCELAWMAAEGSDCKAGAGYAEEAFALAEELAEPEILAVALTTVARVTFWRTGRIRRDLLDHAIELERTIGGDGSARVLLARVLSRSGRYDEARALWRDLIAEATERENPWVVGRLFFLAHMEATAGQWDTAARLCGEAIELARQTGWDMFEPLCLVVLAKIDAYRGEAERARAAIPDLLHVTERAGYGDPIHELRLALAVLELSAGDAASSWRHVAPLCADFEEMDEYLARVVGSVAIEALAAIGDADTAEWLLALLDEHAAEPDSSLRPLAARSRGALGAARGDYDGAIAALEAATEEPEPPQQASPFERARTLLVLGTVHRQAHHKRAARETLEQSLEIFDGLGARMWADRARSELRRIGGRIPSEGQLSETERQIVELVVAGRRNREVAAELSLSPNTIAWNLSKVYRKLGVTSRTELAAHMAATPRA